MSCSQCAGIEGQFDAAAARKKLRRFRRRGPDRTTRLLIELIRDALDASDTRDAVLLDVGGGIGAIHHALLDGRVARAVHVDASTAQIAAAREETERQGHGARVDFVRGDFVALADELPAADIVTLDRVICCFDDMDRLVTRSARKAARFYGAVYPRDLVWMRIAIAAINVVQRLKRTGFRVFLHDPAAIDGVLRGVGLAPSAQRRTAGWHVVLYARRSPEAAGDGHR
jgi:SAM-dependent methyltransferase